MQFQISNDRLVQVRLVNLNYGGQSPNPTSTRYRLVMEFRFRLTGEAQKANLIKLNTEGSEQRPESANIALQRRCQYGRPTGNSVTTGEIRTPTLRSKLPHNGRRASRSAQDTCSTAAWLIAIGTKKGRRCNHKPLLIDEDNYEARRQREY